jgi:D-glycero-D-manno-heptose 1,7-bisphosphate phosphatase
VSSGWQTPLNGGPLVLLSAAAARGASSVPRAAVFVDRDGVINELVAEELSGHGESPLSVDDVRLIPGAAVALARLARAGHPLVCVSNQPAAAKGAVSVPELMAIHERVIELLGQEGAHLIASYLCPHHPEGVVAELTGVCACRKPSPGMLHAAADALGLDLGSSWMVGDTDADLGAGSEAGCRTLLIVNPGSAHKRLQGLNPTLAEGSLAAGVGLLSLD